MVRLNINAIKDETSERNRFSCIEEGENKAFSFKDENDHNDDEQNQEWPDE